MAYGRPSPAGMLQSVQSMAQVTLTTEADVTDAMRLREGLARQWTNSGLNPMHVVIKAIARALKEHPRMNAVQREDEVELVEDINIGLAVSLPEGLIVPVHPPGRRQKSGGDRKGGTRPGSQGPGWQGLPTRS